MNTEQKPSFLTVLRVMSHELHFLYHAAFWVVLTLWALAGAASFFECPWGEWGWIAMWGRWALGYHVLSMISIWYMVSSDYAEQLMIEQRLEEERKEREAK